MNLSFYVKLYALTIPVFFAIDIIWLGVVAKSYYRNQLDGILGQNVNWFAAITFYLIYIAGILFFAVRPSLQQHSMITALYMGALYGFFTYATYDLTNMALLDGWPLQIAIVDITWGVILCASVSAVSYLIATRLL